MRARARAYTLVELLVVLAIIALLMSLVAPRYFSHVDRAKEAVLRQQLATMREAIDRFYGTHDRYPDTLQALVDTNYLRAIPEDPITERNDTWKLVVDERHGPGIYDVHSGAEGVASDGKPFATW